MAYINLTDTNAEHHSLIGVLCAKSLSRMAIHCRAVVYVALALQHFFCKVPDGMDPIAAAPFLCAGVTVFNALRGTNDKAKQPAIVAVVGYESHRSPVGVLYRLGTCLGVLRCVRTALVPCLEEVRRFIRIHFVTCRKHLGCAPPDTLYAPPAAAARTVVRHSVPPATSK